MKMDPRPTILGVFQNFNTAIRNVLSLHLRALHSYWFLLRFPVRQSWRKNKPVNCWRSYVFLFTCLTGVVFGRVQKCVVCADVPEECTEIPKHLYGVQFSAGQLRSQNVDMEHVDSCDVLPVGSRVHRWVEKSGFNDAKGNLVQSCIGMSLRQIVTCIWMKWDVHPCNASRQWSRFSWSPEWEMSGRGACLRTCNQRNFSGFNKLFDILAASVHGESRSDVCFASGGRGFVELSVFLPPLKSVFESQAVMRFSSRMQEPWFLRLTSPPTTHAFSLCGEEKVNWEIPWWCCSVTTEKRAK